MEGIKHIGVNDRDITLFEGQFEVEKGMAYNSYVVFGEKIAVMDTVDKNFTHQWLDNLQEALDGRQPDYLVVHHMEPDHSALISMFMKNYPTTKIVATSKAFGIMKNYFGEDYSDRKIEVGDKSELDLGGRKLTFFTAPMVHWPEVMVSYDDLSKTLFSADAFGKFGTTDADEDWACEARRYYFGIVGKFGIQVQTLLKKLSGLNIENICPLHGPTLTENIDYYLNLYNLWSSYQKETDGVAIIYTTVYGNTEKAVLYLHDALIKNGCKKVSLINLTKEDVYEGIEDAFRYGNLVLATTTYNGGIFPAMKEFIEKIKDRNYQNRTVAFIENGSWAPVAGKAMKKAFEESKNINFIEEIVRINGVLNADNYQQLDKMAESLCEKLDERKEKVIMDNSAMNKIGYGLYVVTTNDGVKDNGCIVNTVMQLTTNPNKVAVTVNKLNYTYNVIMKTGKLNVNCLDETAPFSVFEKLGFVSGRNVDKFANCEKNRSSNGLMIINKYINSYMSLTVLDSIDVGTHTTFICSVDESKVINDNPSMTYAYYHANVKPKPVAKSVGKKTFVCQICGYVYEGESLPKDFICPLCKHGAEDFEEVK